MAQPAADEDELWEVALAPGEQKVMTLDQLDDAYRLGIITESTMVCESGSDDWQPLYVVAGLDPPEPSDPPTARLDLGSDPPTQPHPLPPAAPPPAMMKRTVMGLGPGGYEALLAPNEAAGAAPPPLPSDAFAKYPQGATAPKALSVPTTSGRKARSSYAPGQAAAPVSRVSRPAPAAAPPSRPAPAPSSRPVPPPRSSPGAAISALPPPRAITGPPPLPRIEPAPQAASASARPLPLPRIEPAPRTGSSSAPPLPRIEPVARAGAFSSAPPQPLPRIEPAPRLQPSPSLPASPLSYPPQLVDDASAAPSFRRGIPSAELWIFAAALFCGLFVTVQRYGALEQWATSMGLGSAYAQFENAVFGGPSLNTPRGVKHFLEQQKAADRAAAAEALAR